MKRFVMMIIMVLFFFSSSLSLAHPPIYTESLLDAVALSEDIKQDVLVVFTAGWCGSCQVLKADIRSSNEGVLDNHIVCYIDYDANKEMVKEYRVKRIPDCFILRKNREIKRKVGYDGWANFKQWLHKDND